MLHLRPPGEQVGQQAKHCCAYAAHVSNPCAPLQKHAAAELVAVARSLALEASRACKRQRVQPKLSHRASSSSSPFLGARVAVYWPNDKQFYKVLSSLM